LSVAGNANMSLMCGHRTVLLRKQS